MFLFINPNELRPDIHFLSFYQKFIIYWEQLSRPVCLTVRTSILPQNTAVTSENIKLNETFSVMFVLDPYFYSLMNCKSCNEDRDTYPQLRQRLEQVKYSSGKNELLVMCSSGISPLKLSLRAYRKEPRGDGGTERVSNVHSKPKTLRITKCPVIHTSYNQASLPAEPCRWRWQSVGSVWCCYPAVAPGCAADHWSLWEGCRSEFHGIGRSWMLLGTDPVSWNAPAEDGRPIR